MSDQNPENRPPRRGRPRAAEPLERVSTRLPIPAFNRLCELAKERDESVSMVVRRLLILRLPKP